MSSVLITLLVAGAALLLAGLVVAVGLAQALAGGDELQERVQAYAALPFDAPQRGDSRRRARFVRFRVRLNAMLSSVGSEEAALRLLSANWPLTVTEYTLIRFGGTLLSFLLVWGLVRQPLAGIGLGLLCYIIPEIFLRRSINRRRLAFEGQLVDVLVLLNGAVRAGFSLLQAAEVIERELPAPASEEFHRVTREVGLGLSLGDALENMAERMDNTDLDLVVAAVKIHFQVGGNLATMLEAVTETIRERVRLFREARVISTQQRYTSYILTLLPFIVGGVLFLINPEYMSRLFLRENLCFPIGALVGIALGNLWIRRLARIEV